MRSKNDKKLVVSDQSVIHLVALPLSSPDVSDEESVMFYVVSHKYINFTVLVRAGGS